MLDTASGQPTSDEGAWTWKELLNTLDGDAAAGPAAGRPVDGPALGDDLFAEIEAMGIDPGALLPKGRVDEIAAAIQTGDGLGAREVVRTLAPAAIRRVARRLLSDPNFRARGQALVARYAGLIAEASERDKEGFQCAALLATKSGRAYLLLDAAAGQPG